MKKLLFDLYWAQPTGTSKYHGGGEYIKAVFKQLVETKHTGIQIDVFYNFNSFIDDWVVEIIRKYDIKTINIERFDDLNRIINFEQYDTFYTGMPYAYRKIGLPSDVCKIATFHGIRSVELPFDKYTYKYCRGKSVLKALIKKMIGESYFRNREIVKLKNSMDLFDKVITDSIHSKYSFLVNNMKRNSEDIFVAYAPSKIVADIDTEHNRKQYNELGITKKYILLVSGDRWIKNCYRAVKAIDELMDNNITDYQVVVTGGFPKHMYDKLRHKDKFISLGYIDTDLLELLYKRCDMFVYPTLNEGFGLPPVEAMKYGKTCIISAVCSLPEIYGDSVYYINPYDEMEIKNRVLMASERKIPINIINDKVKEIQQQQSIGLERLCEYITQN